MSLTSSQRPTTGGVMMDCKKCGQECYRESVDVGVGVLHGPWGCPCCGWSDDPEYDCSEGESPATKRTGFYCGPTGMLDPTQPTAKAQPQGN